MTYSDIPELVNGCRKKRRGSSPSGVRTFVGGRKVYDTSKPESGKTMVWAETPARAASKGIVLLTKLMER